MKKTKEVVAEFEKRVNTEVRKQKKLDITREENYQESI